MSDVCTRLAALFTAVENPKHNKKNSYFGNSYADLESILTSLNDVVQSHGFRLHQTVVDGVKFNTSLVDVKDEDAVIIGVVTPFILQDETPQGVGSALTYYRRYGALLIFNLVGEEDDDAEKASGRGEKKSKPKGKPKAAKKDKPSPAAQGASASEVATGEVEEEEEDW